MRSNTSIEMKTHGADDIFIFVAFAIAMNAWGVPGAATASDNSSTVLKGLKAPGSPENQWQPPDLGEFASVLKAKPEPETDAQKDYELAELIDLAERTNPETKVAWEHAKQAAAAVGLAQSEYFPLLALRASAGYVREP